MNKFFNLLILIAILALAGCNPTLSKEESEMHPTQNPTDQPNVKHEKPGFTKSDAARETDPKVSSSELAALITGNTEFALNFYQQIRGHEGNIIYSPFSLSLALSMAMAGAEGETESAMMEALCLPSPEEAVYPSYNALLLALESSQTDLSNDSGNSFQLNLANSLWGQAGYAFKPAFLDTLARHFGAGMYQVDFLQNPESARVAINDWVEEATKEKIQDLVPEGVINTLTRLVLANAIYFKGSWQYPFDEAGTAEAPFTLLDGSTTQVDMMKLFGKSLPYLQGDGYQAVSLSYLNSDFVMTFLVPDEGNFEAYESALSADQLQGDLSMLESDNIQLQLPKFDFETTTDAKEPLIALGMGAAFEEEEADFSGITKEEALMITDVLHKATITVDEQGTEAAAATAVIIGLKSAMPQEPVSLVIDRPFLFLIRHQPTGSILFMGRVVEP